MYSLYNPAIIGIGILRPRWVLFGIENGVDQRTPHIVIAARSRRASLGARRVAYVFVVEPVVLCFGVSALVMGGVVALAAVPPVRIVVLVLPTAGAGQFTPARLLVTADGHPVAVLTAGAATLDADNHRIPIIGVMFICHDALHDCI